MKKSGLIKKTILKLRKFKRIFDKRLLKYVGFAVFILIFTIVTLNIAQKKVSPLAAKKTNFIEEKQKGMGFGLNIPKKWRGKYVIEERVFQDKRYTDYYFKGKNNENWLIFTIEILSDNAWKEIVNSGQAEGKQFIKSINGNSIILTRPNKIPEFKNPNYDEYQKLASDVDSIAGNIILTGEYSFRTVSVFFARNVDKDCSHVEAIQRVLDHRGDYERGALLELMKGLTIEEKELGFNSFFSEATASELKGFKIINKTAYVNLNDLRSKIPNASSSCGGAQLLSEIEQTLLQFPSVKKVAIAINGQPDVFYEWLQYGCPDKDVCNSANFQTIN